MKQTILTLFLSYSWSFHLFAQSWNQVGSSILGENANEYAGYSVAMNDDGTTIVFGSTLNSDAALNSGQVRTYQWNGTNWVQKGNDINGQSMGDQSGWSVCISDDGNTIGIGSPVNGDAGSYAGQVRVYNWNGSAWIQKGLDIHGEASYDESGSSVSMSSDGNIIAIGAPGNNNYTGHVRVYSWNGSAWVQMGSDINGEALNDYFGRYSISLSDDGLTVATGAFINDGGGSNSGHTRVYSWNGSAWIQKGIDIDGTSGQQSGWAVDLNGAGTRVAIGSPLSDLPTTDCGSFKVYDWNGSSWVLLGSEILGVNAGDALGNSISMSTDGSKVTVGSYTFGSTDRGQVVSYQWNGSTWQLVGSAINGTTDYDVFGHAVASSGDGTVIIGGSPYNDDNGSNSGNSRIYCYPSYTSLIESNCTSVSSPSGLYTWTTSGIYSDTLTSIFGCDSIFTVDVTILKSTSSFSEFVCDTVFYSPTGTAWMTSGIYKDTIPNTFGCDSIMTFNLSFVQPDTTISIANSVYTVGQSAAIYQWQDCNTQTIIPGETNQTFSPSVDGTYGVIITLNGCIDTSGCYSIVNVGNSEYFEKEISIYPNPAEDFLLINDLPDKCTISIYALNGSLVLKLESLGGSSLNADISSLKSGNYFIEIISEEATFRQLFTKK